MKKGFKKIFYKHNLFLLLISLFLFAVFAASFFRQFFYGLDPFLFLLLSLTFLGLLLTWRKKKTRIFLLLILFLLLGVWRYSFFLSSEIKTKKGINYGASQELEGLLKSDPEVMEDRQKFVFSNSGEHNSGADFLVFADKYPELHYGDLISFQCSPERPEPFEGFSYDRYLAMKGVYGLCYYPEIEIINRGEGHFFLSSIYSFKRVLKKKIEENLDEPASSVFLAMFLGDKSLIGDDLQKDFSRAGLSHIIAISGMHIGIFIAGLVYIFSFLGLHRSKSFYLIAAFLLFYNIIIAFPASAVRASLMGLIILYGYKAGRLGDIKNSIALAAFLMAFYNPLYLRYDVGFVFSFLAVLGIVIFYPLLNNFFKAPKNKLLTYTKDIFLVSVSAQIFLAPLLLKNFSTFSLVSPLVNILVIWVLPLVLLLGVAALFLSFFLPALAFFFFLPLKAVLFYILSVADFFAQSSVAALEYDLSSRFILAAYYILPLILYFYLDRAKKDIISF